MPKNQSKIPNFKWFLANAYFDPRVMKDAQLCFIEMAPQMAGLGWYILEKSQTNATSVDYAGRWGSQAGS